MPSKRVVVVGTTSDYVEYIRSRYPERAFFVTDRHERSSALEPVPAPDEELVADLTDEKAVLEILIAQTEQWKITVSGIACFDCESMMLASTFAHAMAVPFPTAEAVARCRNKHVARQQWRAHRVPCPESMLITDTSLLKTFPGVNGSLVLKPLTGSGSELVFKCCDEHEAVRAFHQIQTRLARHPNVRMYPTEGEWAATNSGHAIQVEAYIEGTEYSCDFFFDGRRAVIIRLAEKLTDARSTFGTALAYFVPAALPEELSRRNLEQILETAVRALGLERAVCMADIIVNGDGLHLLEVAPRPGGDCLPALIRQSCGLDMLGLTLDVAEGRTPEIPKPEHWRPMVGVRLLAHASGIVKTIDDRLLKEDRRVKDFFFKARPGYRIVLPPDDYDSRILGHVIFSPHTAGNWRKECFEVLTKVRVDIVT